MHQVFLVVGSTPDDSTYLIAIGLGAFVLIYLTILRPKMRGKKDPLEKQPFRSGMAQQRALERDMQSLLVEYEQMIRNMTSQLDTRASKLELLIKEADEKLAALRTAGTGSMTTTTTTTGSTTSGFAPAGDSGAGVETEAAIARATDLTPTPRRDPTGPDPRHAEVYALADQGLSPRDVARKLGRPNGEIELILALRTARD
jgi:hypothetical protein